jgi:hypothetical protein
VTAPAYEVWPDDRLADGRWLLPWPGQLVQLGDPIELVVARTTTRIPCTVTGCLPDRIVVTEVPAVDNATEAGSGS